MRRDRIMSNNEQRYKRKEVIAMHRSFILLLISGVLLITSCQPKVNLEAEKEQVKAVLDSYITSIETENMELYSKVMTHDQDMVNYGTSGAPIIGWDALKKVIEDQNSALSQTKITVSDLAIHVSDNGKFAWATCLWNFKAMIGDKLLELPVRCTWILEKGGNGWVIVHFHKSVAAG